jgi:hypothetical protein
MTQARLERIKVGDYILLAGAGLAKVTSAWVLETHGMEYIYTGSMGSPVRTGWSYATRAGDLGQVLWSRVGSTDYLNKWDIIGHIPKENYEKNNSKITWFVSSDVINKSAQEKN